MSTAADSDSYTSTRRSLSDDSECINKHFGNLNLCKINPLPLTRKIQTQSAVSRNRLQIYQYKHFSKVPATGKSSYKILNYLKNSPSIKTVQSLEFDPYLCDSSYLKYLAQILKKLPKMKKFDVNIPRVDRSNESNILIPFMKRLAKLTALRVNVPTTENINEDGLLQILGAIKRCYMLKRVEIRFVNTAQPSNKFELELLNLYRKHKKLEEIVEFHSVRKGIIKDEFDYQVPYKPYIIPLLKKLDMTCSVAREWCSKTGEEEQETEEFCTQWVYRFANVEEMNCNFVNVRDVNEVNVAFNAMICLTRLKTMNYESLGCRIGDLELMTLLFGITKLKQLKNLNFKLIQPPSVSEMAIARFVDVISKLDHLENFNIYIRRVELPDQMIQELVREICRTSNVRCDRYKGSLHFYRYKNAYETELDI